MSWVEALTLWIRAKARQRRETFDDGPRIREDHGVDVDVCVKLGEVSGGFSQEKFGIAKEGVFRFVPFSFNG